MGYSVEYTEEEINEALYYLLEFDSYSVYQKNFGVVVDYITELENTIENLLGGQLWEK